ncbi:MAG: chromosome segregation protein SMC [Clostridia bacterium]|nr:chromosome segregation protein SMC [Clostridia bacterium]
MRLKSVELQGFKSFADKIYLDFNPGITAIVGPNGSGKSNISDAIRWVLGEQSARSLRGSRMEDVIFAGTEVRKPQGFAEVSLTLDNSEKELNIDYEEVVVTRRVYRSGEGEYFINRNACRLKDIHELFMDTGIGREGYSIIGQGKIDEILSNKSEDRRRIFEEAAGITKYKYRKNEAEKKLEKTNENLTRVNDIMSELSGQLEPLRIQSEKARKYLNLRDELRVIDVNVSVASIGKHREELVKIDNNLEAVSNSIETLQKAVDEKENLTKEMYELIESYEAQMEQCRVAQKAASEESAEEQNRINLAYANIEHCKENIQRINDEIGKSQRGVEQLDKLIEDYTKVYAQLSETRQGLLGKISEAQAEFEKINLTFQGNNESIESLKTAIIDKTAEIGSLRSKVANYNILIENFSRESKNIESELETHSSEHNRIAEENKKIEDNLSKLTEEFEELKNSLAVAEEKFEILNGKTEELAEKKNEVLAELNKKNSHKSVLEDMENDFEGYNRSVKAVMTAHSEGVLKNARIYGPITKLISTDKKYVTAIEVALTSVNQNIVTEDEQDAKAAINYLKANKLGRATFMPISTVRTRNTDLQGAEKMKGYIALAQEIVEYDKKYDGVVGSVLGGTVVVDNIDNAIAMAAKCGHKFKIVTVEGEVMQPGGAMSGGSMGGKNAGFLSRAAEIEKLKSEIELLQAELQKIEDKKIETNDELQKISIELAESRNVLSEKNEEYIRAKSNSEHSRLFLEAAEARTAQLNRERETIEERTREIADDIVLCNKNADELEAEVSSLRLETDSKQSESEGIYQKVKEIQDLLVALQIEESSNQKDIEVQNERLENVKNEKTAILDENKAKQLEVDLLNGKIAAITNEIETDNKKLSEIGNKAQELEKQLAELSDNRKNTDAKSRELQEQVKEVREQLFALGQQKAKVEGAKAKCEGDLDGLFEYLWNEYELTYSDAVKLKTEDEFDFKAATVRISELKSKIKSLGNINIDAIEEYKTIKERFDFLTEQTVDLEKAKGDLEKIIDEMMTIMKKQFSEQFAVISKNFNNVFRELFGGGQAQLELADPDDIMETGVEIVAQPPGKKLQSLTLLSGGERAFTAIALLFAILKVRPTPFCILDEIEAALDDINVYRYADYLKKYSKKSQFIVVTHRRGTMEAANILYGVTMQEKGISKLLSLNIDEVAE